MKAETFKNSINKMMSLPLWIKQIIYMYLKADIKRILNNRPIDVNPYDMLQLYRPKITFKGKKELNDRIYNHEETMYTFLQAILDNKSIIEITLDNYLTLAETANLYLNALEQEYVMPSNLKKIDAVAEFFCGKIKTGEYLYRIGRLGVDDLNNVIKIHDKMRQEGNNTPMAKIISDLGLIEEDEIKAILVMKSEAEKRLIYGSNVNTLEIEDKDAIELKNRVEELEYENNYLKTKIATLLKMN